MTSAAVESLRADREALLEICAGLTDAQWKAESGCAGWTVHDVVAHMGGLWWTIVDPSQLPDTGDAPTEQAQEIIVESRRSWTPQQVVDDYTEVSVKALEAAVDLESQDFEMDLGSFGTYHISVLPNAFAFDHYTHIRADLFAPRGPLTGTPPPSDELHLRPTLDWIAAALPQHSADAVAKLPGGVEISATGVAARVIVAGDGPVVAAVESDAPSLVRWITQRGTLGGPRRPGDRRRAGARCRPDVQGLLTVDPRTARVLCAPTGGRTVRLVEVTAGDVGDRPGDVHLVWQLRGDGSVERSDEGDMDDSCCEERERSGVVAVAGRQHDVALLPER